MPPKKAKTLCIEIANLEVTIFQLLLANNGDVLKDSEQRNGKSVSEASSLEGGFTQSLEERSA